MSQIILIEPSLKEFVLLKLILLIDFTQLHQVFLDSSLQEYSIHYKIGKKKEKKKLKNESKSIKQLCAE